MKLLFLRTFILILIPFIGLSQENENPLPVKRMRYELAFYSENSDHILDLTTIQNGQETKLREFCIKYFQPPMFCNEVEAIGTYIFLIKLNTEKKVIGLANVRRATPCALYIEKELKRTFDGKRMFSPGFTANSFILKMKTEWIE